MAPSFFVFFCIFWSVEFVVRKKNLKPITGFLIEFGTKLAGKERKWKRFFSLFREILSGFK